MVVRPDCRPIRHKILSSGAFDMLSLVFLGLVLSLLANYILLPNISKSVYWQDDLLEQEFRMPLAIPSTDSQRINLRLDIFSFGLFKTDLIIMPDDCIEEIRLDGKNVQLPSVPLCGFKPTVLPVGEMLSLGHHTLSIRLLDYGGIAKLYLFPSRTSPAFLAYLALQIAIIAFIIWYIVRIKNIKLTGWFLSILIIGIALRIGYASSTPYDTRAHDWDRHVDYIDYVRNNWKRPSPSDAKMVYCHLPLYYFTAAGMNRYGADIQDIARASLPVSSMVLIIGMLTGLLLFRDNRRNPGKELALFFALVASLPDLVFLSSVINNDVAASLFSALFIGSLLCWWRKPGWPALLLMAFLLIAGILSKLTVAPLALAFFGCLLFNPRVSRKSKVIHILVSSLLLISVVGRFTFSRPGSNGYDLICKTNELDSRLDVPVNVSVLTTFNPVGVLKHTFNDPLGTESRKEFMLEYLFRSAFFGEYSFPDNYKNLAFLILAFGIIGLALVPIGIIDDIRKRREFMVPMLWVFIAIMAGYAILRIADPYSPVQDFRYSPMLAIPLFYFAVRGAFALPSLPSRFARSCLWALVCCCAIFIIKIYFSMM